MSYIKEEKRRAVEDQNKIINENGGLKIKELGKSHIPLYVYLIAIGLLVIGVCVVVHGVDAKISSIAPDWEMRIDVHVEEGDTYCIIGEKSLASDGVDGFDVPHPPFEPPGRCFVYSKQSSFPNPHKSLWMEYRHLHGVWRVWNLTCFYVPMYGSGTDVTMTWNTTQVASSGYLNMILCNNGYVANMKMESSYTFYSPVYQITNMKIYCNNLFTH